MTSGAPALPELTSTSQNRCGRPRSVLWSAATSVVDELAMPATVLIVDDNPDSIMVLRSILESKGFAVLTAGDGKDALAVLSKQIPDAVLLDVMMPDLSGIDVLKRMRSTAATAR